MRLRRKSKVIVEFPWRRRGAEVKSKGRARVCMRSLHQQRGGFPS